jgi:hypothetical protein
VHRNVILLEFVYEQDFDQVAYFSANGWSLCALEIRLRCILGEGTVGISPIESFQPFSAVLCISRELGSCRKIERDLIRKYQCAMFSIPVPLHTYSQPIVPSRRSIVPFNLLGSNVIPSYIATKLEVRWSESWQPAI